MNLKTYSHISYSLSHKNMRYKGLLPSGQKLFRIRFIDKNQNPN